MIKPKKKICLGCDVEKYIWSKGKCQGCSNRHTPPLQKSKLSKSHKPRDKKKSEFFKQQIEFYQDKAYSAETGRGLGTITAVNIAHILAKGIFKSLAIEPQNIILLSWEEHTRFDELLFAHEFSKLETEMKNTWSKVCKRLEYLLPLSTETGNLKTALIKYLKTK